MIAAIITLASLPSWHYFHNITVLHFPVQVHIDKDIPFMLNTLKSVQEIHYDKSKIELVVLCLTGNSEVLTWQPQGFASFHLLTQVNTVNEEHDEMVLNYPNLTEKEMKVSPLTFSEQKLFKCILICSKG